VKKTSGQPINGLFNIIQQTGLWVKIGHIKAVAGLMLRRCESDVSRFYSCIKQTVRIRHEGRVNALASRVPAVGCINPENRAIWSMSMQGGTKTCYSIDMDIAASKPEIVFRTEGVTKVYDTGEVKVFALAGVDLQLYAGELTVLLGPSGSGKSTLLNILGGLDHATEGRVWFRDTELTKMKDRALTRFRRDHVGFIFQFYNLVASLSARENVALVTDIAPNPMTPDEALEIVGLKHRMDHFPAELSGGEQQRVAIARAIAKQPEVLLCDEPTGALDSKTGVQVLEALDRINKEFGTTTAVITHAAEIRKMAHRVIRFQDGKIASVEVNETRLHPHEIDW
jgi:putative ABC transport system ATP-binding protein